MDATRCCSKRHPVAESFNLDTGRNLNYQLGEHLWPPIKYSDIGRYFLGRPCGDGEAAEAFKALVSYQYVKSGKVHNIRTARPRQGLCVLKAYVGPSQRSTCPAYECWVQVEENGNIQDARCSCMAGLGRVCSHAAAVCFAVDFWTQVNTPDQTPDQAPTELPCAWVKPRLKKVQPKRSKELSYTRHRYGPQQTVPQKRKSSGLKELPNAEAFMQALQKVAPDARVFTLTTPRPEADRPQLAVPVNVPNDDGLAITIEAPLSTFTSRMLAQRGLQCENIDELAVLVMEKTSISEQNAKVIERATCGQRSAPLWFCHRKGRVTASIFKDVCRSKRVQCTTLVNRIFNPRTINTPPVQYGIANESVAKERLLGYLRGLHSNARIEDCGLMINHKYPLLGCSPDGIFRCDCHEPALVEVKCLYTLRDCNPTDLVAEGQKKNGFCLSVDGQLKVTHAYYYQVQAQLHLNLENIKQCYFYVHVEAGGHLAVVQREEDFMETHNHSVENFIREIVMPRIILGKM